MLNALSIGIALIVYRKCLRTFTAVQQHLR
jgi:hypothetical protein